MKVVAATKKPRNHRDKWIRDMAIQQLVHLPEDGQDGTMILLCALQMHLENMAKPVGNAAQMLARIGDFLA